MKLEEEEVAGRRRSKGKCRKRWAEGSKGKELEIMGGGGRKGKRGRRREKGEGGSSGMGEFFSLSRIPSPSPFSFPRLHSSTLFSLLLPPCFPVSRSLILAQKVFYRGLFKLSILTKTQTQYSKKSHNFFFIFQLLNFRRTV